jgi:TolB-like protein
MSDNPLNQTSLGHDVFVSYASQDAAVANSIVESLEQHGLKCWVAPRDVKPGAQYADAIVRAINEARAVVLVMSGSGVASPHVGKEIERGSSKRKPIIAFRIDAAPLNHALEYFLSESQWIDVPALGIQAALARLKEAVGHESSNSPQAGPAVAIVSDKSIAILPFMDMSEKKDQEYFADGMAEEIIDLLVKIPELKVTARTSSFQFKGQTRDFRTIASRLGVAYVLEGSVRKSGDRLRVTARLIDSRDETHLWSQTYDRNLNDVLKMQDEIAATLVRALQIQVSPVDIVSRAALRSPEAYTLYLQGLHAFDRIDQQGFEGAAACYQRALDLDPEFAAAAAQLALAYFVLGQWGFMPPGVAFEKTREAAQHALTLDPSLAKAHAVLGEVYRAYDWDWAAAHRELQAAVNLAPNDAFVLFVSAVQTLATGNWEDGIKLANASLARDPLNASAYMLMSRLQLHLGRLEEAEAAIRRTLEISPTFSRAHNLLGIALLARGESEAALVEMLKEKDNGGRLGGSAIAYFALDRKADSDTSLAQTLKSEADRRPFLVAQVYAFRGESDEAFNWLDRAYAQRDAGLSLFKGDLSFRSLEDDPRYKAFLKKMNLPE